ncbi:hypothetical protein K470DRAFT_256844 [Piedraia hortae CBS 480.64]|uniref:Ribosomal protein L19 n=1 Tax=Piedraia hortae CBS 480.64 TaxID=1314780 RepID=A0A6A7C357_9PEZI|nr:hypothetical protein K470DRAFT_256844 [Piedraia hortae CBS 480.64]
MKGFRPSQAIKQNRFNNRLAKIPVISPPRSTAKSCRDPIAVITKSQLQTLDPTGERTRLFSDSNPARVKPGDILLVRQKGGGEPLSGVVLAIRQRNSPIDWAVLLRNRMARVNVEMWVKIYSPNVTGMEVVQRHSQVEQHMQYMTRRQARKRAKRAKSYRARRAKLYYMRDSKHDRGSVEKYVQNYMQQRGGTSATGEKEKR